MATFGFGDLTGIDIPGEKPGLMPSTEWKRHAYRRPAEQVWFAGETISVGIGQGYMLATPMQLAHAVSGIASRGQIFKPRLVTAVRAPGSDTLTPRPVQQEPSLTAVAEDQWGVIVDGMELATGPGGTAAAATAGSPYKIAGKTGSAQVFSIGQNEKYNEKQLSERMLDHALFISFAPAEDPKLAVAVFVENGKHGGSTAAPIARKMFDAYLLPEKAGSAEKP
jgi:penicillin-binding protein 2